MKIIDLLNKIANGEEAPKKIKWRDTTYTLYIDEDTKQKYYQDDKCRYFFLSIKCLNDLNDTVEIIEEDKKIPEKLKILNANDHSKKAYYENYSKEEISLDIETLQVWVNKIIDYLKSLKSNR